jgi:DNA-binding HxlR family transcriptional regulator
MNAEVGFQPDVLSAQCPSRAVLKHLTSQWGVLVMLALSQGTLRFSALRRRVGGVSERMLAQTLQVLEGDGLVRRTAHQVVPPHVDYTLTPLGAEAAVRVAELTGWIEAKLPELLAAAAKRKSVA